MCTSTSEKALKTSLIPSSKWSIRGLGKVIHYHPAFDTQLLSIFCCPRPSALGPWIGGLLDLIGASLDLGTLPAPERLPLDITSPRKPSLTTSYHTYIVWARCPAPGLPVTLDLHYQFSYLLVPNFLGAGLSRGPSPGSGTEQFTGKVWGQIHPCLLHEHAEWEKQHQQPPTFTGCF